MKEARTTCGQLRCRARCEGRGAPPVDWGNMAEQEQRVNLLFRNIEDEFDAFDRLDDTSRAESKLRTITGMLRDCKACAPLNRQEHAACAVNLLVPRSCGRRSPNARTCRSHSSLGPGFGLEYRSRQFAPSWLDTRRLLVAAMLFIVTYAGSMSWPCWSYIQAMRTSMLLHTYLLRDASCSRASERHHCVLLRKLTPPAPVSCERLHAG